MKCIFSTNKKTELAPIIPKLKKILEAVLMKGSWTQEERLRMEERMVSKGIGNVGKSK